MTILDDTFDDTFDFFESLFPRNVVPPGNYPPWNLEDDRIKSLLFGQGYPAYPNVQLPYLNSNTAPITLKYKFAGNYINPRELAFVNSVREILEERIEPLINVDFVEIPTNSSESAHITYELFDDPSVIVPTKDSTKLEFVGYNSPIDTISVKNRIRLNSDYEPFENFQEGDFGYRTIIHETLHALGLKHPGRYNGLFSERDLGTAPYLMDDELFGIDGYQLDNSSNTIMTYNGAGALESTPMPYDMLALHYLYGVGDLNSGDTTYNFHDVDQYSSNDLINGHVVTQTWGTTIPKSDSKIALWDRSGIDTFDLSGLPDVANGYRIDLSFEGNETIEGWAGGFVTTNDAYNNQISYFATDHTLPNGKTTAQYQTLGFGTFIAHSHIENVIGSISDDWIVGLDNVRNEISGEGGNDTLIGGDANYNSGNILNGGDGDDLLDGGTGNDTLDGGVGKDSLNGWEGNDSLKGGDGNDILDGGDGDDTLKGLDGNDFLDGYIGNDSLNGDSGNDTLQGDLGNDSLTAGRGNDFLDGGRGNDSLRGIDGNNTLQGGTGGDTLDGGIGSDTLNGEDDHDHLYGRDGNDSLNGGTGIDYLNGGLGNDLLDGEIGDDFLDGREGNDSLNGGDSDDLLKGGNDEDRLIGGYGNDSLAGEDGNDTLIGSNPDYYDSGSGENDTLTGGLGADTFVIGDSYEAYYLDAGNALITDFNWMEEDKIQVFGNPDDYSLIETTTIGGEVGVGMDIVYQENTIATLVGNTGFRYVDDNTVRFDININQDFEFV